MSYRLKEDGLGPLYLKILPTMPLAIFPASPVVEKAVPAMLDAWLNLSHRENARELVMVKTIAITIIKPVSHEVSPRQVSHVVRPGSSCIKLTHEREPNKHQPHQRQYRQRNPQQRLDVVCQPKETAIGRVDCLGAGLAALKDPFGVARRWVHLVPPPQANKAPPSDIFEVVEVGGEEKDGNDKDQDAVKRRGQQMLLIPPA